MNMNINTLLDPVVNFGKVTVSPVGYNSSETNITLEEGGSKLPDTASGSFNLVWFDSSTYSDPADDPKVEIVRCINRSGNALILMRGEEGTLASTKNTPGKIYKMILAPTKKTIDDIGIESQSKVNTHSALSTGVHGVGADTIDGVGARNIAISTHSSVISSVHGFNASGDAPAQTHGISKHTGTIGDHQGNLTGIGTNTHAQIDTAIGTTLPGLVTTHAALTTGVHGITSNILINKGRAWIAHGDNVITLPVAQANTNFLSEATIHLPSMGGVTTRGPTHTNPMTITTKPDTASRLLVKLHGGFGFTSCGFIAALTGLTERFDDVANTQTARTAATARYSLTGYSLNGFGFTSCGTVPPLTGTTDRFDDVANTQTARTAATGRTGLAGYSLNGFGFTICGSIAANTGLTERFDDVANTQTARTAATARTALAGYSLNGFGFTSCGITDVFTGTTERFDDVANTQTARTAATARYGLTGYSLNGFGFTSCGSTNVTERFDDVANTQTARTAATARYSLTGYSLNGFGFTSCGFIAAITGITDRFDDVANTQTARTAATAREYLAGYSTNEYFVNFVTEDA